MDYPEAGELDKRVRFRRVEHLPMAGGGLEASFPSEFDRWAKIVPVGTASYLAGMQTDRKITHRILVRYLEGVESDFEIVHRATVYRVERSAPLKGGRDFTVFEVEQLTNDS
ncbi:phage head closure protein [Achromobacter xylosoxidans]